MMSCGLHSIPKDIKFEYNEEEWEITFEDVSKSWAGNPNNNDKNKNYDFIIDYVKVMKRK